MNRKSVATGRGKVNSISASNELLTILSFNLLMEHSL